MQFDNIDIERIMKEEPIAVYGAGLMGRAVFKCLNSNTYRKKISNFIVNDRAGKPEQIYNVRVISITEATYYRDKLVLVALHDKNMDSAVTALEKQGFTNILPISFDSDLWTDLRGNWMADEGLGICKCTPIVTSLEKQSRIFVVHSNCDKRLAEKEVMVDYEKHILAGASLTDNIMFECNDNSGENISFKNREYCELTAIYWAWKNDESQVVGLSHYRRRFVFDKLEAGESLNGVDVLITVPIFTELTVREQYAKDHRIQDWDIMLEAIAVLYPDYIEAANSIQSGHYYYGYNMFVTRKPIWDAYCRWLFDILNYCEKHIKRSGDSYQDRYAGFLAERLLTIYLKKNEYLKIGVANKHFISNVE